MERKTGMAGFAAVTVLLVLFTALFAGKTAMCRADPAVREREEAYLERERELAGAVRELLEEEGFADCGVMVTRTVDADGSRSYRVAVHHKRIDRLDDMGRERLAEEIGCLFFEDEAGSFSIEL